MGLNCLVGRRTSFVSIWLSLSRLLWTTASLPRFTLRVEWIWRFQIPVTGIQWLDANTQTRLVWSPKSQHYPLASSSRTDQTKIEISLKVSIWNQIDRGCFRLFVWSLWESFHWKLFQWSFSFLRSPKNGGDRSDESSPMGWNGQEEWPRGMAKEIKCRNDSKGILWFWWRKSKI